ncbi:hypothetical protein [Nocardia mexicana]|uniref:Deazaflavin-dependent oxidoreductase (Nitroreductase family) n=1 Tax=Nocardia mexicana TaxID=279262 RepID=A0A370H4Q8_9NOCA|nr:hypothetical protein [Nocardia mexicana]RDI51135.1 hypothetical protein DFR68_105613 [Nocardia mexicana]
MTTKYRTPSLGATAVLLALHLPVGLRRTIGELRYEGHLSGRHIALPVAFVRADGTVIVRVARAATKTWWRNFRTPHPISIRTGRTWLAGTGHVVMPGSLEHERTEAIYQQAHPRDQVSALDPYVVIDVNPGAAPHTSTTTHLWHRWFVAVTLGEFLGFVAPAMAATTGAFLIRIVEPRHLMALG